VNRFVQEKIRWTTNRPADFEILLSVSIPPVEDNLSPETSMATRF